MESVPASLVCVNYFEQNKRADTVCVSGRTYSTSRSYTAPAQLDSHGNKLVAIDTILCRGGVAPTLKWLTYAAPSDQVGFMLQASFRLLR